MTTYTPDQYRAITTPKKRRHIERPLHIAVATMLKHYESRGRLA